MRRLAMAIVAVGVVGVGFGAAQQPKPDIAAGRQLFHQHCSICHGVNADGLGTSEEGSYLEPRTVPAADLTALAQQNGGVFPAGRVKSAILNKGGIPAHGAPDMPAWGNAFYELKSQPRVYEARIRDITAYIESIQLAAR